MTKSILAQENNRGPNTQFPSQLADSIRAILTSDFQVFIILSNQEKEQHQGESETSLQESMVWTSQVGKGRNMKIGRKERQTDQ